MAEDKRTAGIKNQATYNLIPGKTEPTIEEAITAALQVGDIGGSMRIRRGANNNEFQLQLKRNANFSTGGRYLHLTRAEIDQIIQQHFSSRQAPFETWVAAADGTAFDL